MRRIAGAMVIAGALAGCSEPELKAAGEPCVASAECAAGLLCDLGGTPPVCAAHITTDARVIDAALIDAARVDAARPDAAVDAATDAPPAAIP
jgi:hypothetical protein